MIRVCSFLFITYFLHNNIQEDWLLYKKNTFNSAHTKQSATSEITTTKKKQTRKCLKYKQEKDNNSLVLQVSLDEPVLGSPLIIKRSWVYFIFAVVIFCT